MKRSVWLFGLMERIMAEADSPLRISFDWLCQTACSDAGVVYLREPKREADKCMAFSGSGIRCIPVAEADLALLEAAKKACRKETPSEENDASKEAPSEDHNAGKEAPSDILSFKLSFEEADAFGGISFARGSVTNEKWLQEALVSFSTAVYRELMSGFWNSEAPEMLRGENVCMNYSRDGSQPNTLDHVSFSIRRGQFTVIMGRSGSGKSTLLNIIGGMLTPTEGELWFGDQNVASFGRKQRTAYRRDYLGFVFQNYNLIGELTARENVEVAISLAKNADSAEDLLRQVGLEKKQASYPTHMSGGEQQRVSIARALVKRPQILLCDEPTGALDTENAKKIMILLQSIVRQNDIAVVMVTHNPEFISLADHYIEMENGRIKTDLYQPFPYSAEDLA